MKLVLGTALQSYINWMSNDNNTSASLHTLCLDSTGGSDMLELRKTLEKIDYNFITWKYFINKRLGRQNSKGEWQSMESHALKDEASEAVQSTW